MPIPFIKGIKKFRIKLFGVSMPVSVVVTEDGITLGIQGTKKKVALTWYELACACKTDTNVPSFMFGKPLAFLEHMARTAIANGGHE